MLDRAITMNVVESAIARMQTGACSRVIATSALDEPVVAFSLILGSDLRVHQPLERQLRYLRGSLDRQSLKSITQRDARLRRVAIQIFAAK